MQILINFKPVSEGLPIDGMRCIVFGGGKWFDGVYNRDYQAWVSVNGGPILLVENAYYWAEWDEPKPTTVDDVIDGMLPDGWEFYESNTSRIQTIGNQVSVLRAAHIINVKRSTKVNCGFGPTLHEAIIEAVGKIE